MEKIGKKDIVTKEYMADSHVFADVFNQFLYKGEQVIEPGNLSPCDSVQTAVPYGADGALAPVQKYRDGFKVLAAKEDGQAAYLLLGLENQSEPQYAMLVKGMVYDALAYAGQVEQAVKSRRKKEKENKGKKENKEEKDIVDKISVLPGEYLAGFHKGDRLLPIVTLTVFWGTKDWDAPMCLHDMFKVKDERILSFVPDYRINLLSPGRMSEEEIGRFRTDLREVLLFIKYSRDRKKLKAAVEENEGFRYVSWEAVKVINAVTGARIKADEKEEVVDLCQAISEMCKEAEEHGIERGFERGREEGLERGRQEGHQRGLQEGIRQGIAGIVRNMLEIGKFSYGEIAQFCGVSVEEIEAIQFGVVCNGFNT